MLGRAQVAGGQLGVLRVHPSSKALPQEKMTPRKKNPAVGYSLDIFGRACAICLALLCHIIGISRSTSNAALHK